MLGNIDYKWSNYSYISAVRTFGRLRSRITAGKVKVPHTPDSAAGW
jgi:hypothetical protein